MFRHTHHHLCLDVILIHIHLQKVENLVFYVKRGTYTRKTPYGKAKQLLENLADDQKRISAIFARGSHGVDDAALERELKQYEPKH